jgi:hypothetical protein
VGEEKERRKMNKINDAISELEANCVTCKIGRALSALRELQADNPTKAEPTQPKPTKAAPKRAAVTNPPHAASKTVRSDDGNSKECHGCGKMLALDRYPGHKQCVDKHTGTCYDCTKARVARNYKAKQERKSKAEKAKPAPEKDQPAAAIPAKLHECDICEASFRSLDTLDQHRRMRHEGVV